MTKKIIVLLLAIILSLTFLSSCGENKDTGNIKDIDVSKDVSAENKEEEKSMFTPTPEPFGYTYKKFKNERADMQFSYPSEWDCTVHNARHIELNPNEEDKTFSTFTTHILYKYNMGSEESKSFVANYDRLFQSDLIGLKYKLEGKDDFQELNYVSSTSQLTDDSFTSDPDRISLGIRENVDLVEPLGSLAKDSYTALYYSVYWDQYPCIIATVCKSSELDNAKTMLNHMVSTMEPIKKHTTEIYKNYQYEGITLPLPDAFKQNEDFPNLFSASPDETSKYAGMYLGIFEITGTIEDTSFAYDYAPTIANTFISNGHGSSNNHMYAPNTPAKTIKFGNKEATEFLSTCVINSKNQGVGAFYKNGDTYFLHNIIIDEGNGKNTVVTLWYLDGQFFTEQKLFKELKTKIHFDAQ